MSVLGVYKFNSIFGFFVAFGLVLGAIYMLRLVRQIVFTIEARKETTLKELIFSEKIILSLFAILSILLGLMPNILLRFIDSFTLKLLLNF